MTPETTLTPEQRKLVDKSEKDFRDRLDAIYKRRRATIIEIQRICEEALDHDHPYNLVRQSIEDALRKEKEESERIPTWGEIEARKIREKANK